MPSVRLNTPVALKITDNAQPTGGVSGAGTQFPFVVTLPADYAKFDIGTAGLIRITRWRATISIVKSVTITHDASGDSWSFTSTVNGTVDLPEKTTLAGGGALTDEERSFSQDDAGNNAQLVAESFGNIWGTISGTYTDNDASGPPSGSFSGTFDGDPSDGVTLQFNSMEIFDGNKGALGIFAELSQVFFDLDTFTPPTTPPPPYDPAIVIATEWSGASETQWPATCTIRIPSWTGSGTVEVTTFLGQSTTDAAPAGHTLNTHTITGSILFEPIKSLGYNGVWNTATGARLLNPLTASV